MVDADILLVLLGEGGDGGRCHDVVPLEHDEHRVVQAHGVRTDQDPRHEPHRVGAETDSPRQHLESAIAALPEHQRLVLILRDVEGCSTQEVCNALRFQETNIRVLLYRARAKVRAALEPYLYEAA